MANTISFSDYFMNFLKNDYPNLKKDEQDKIASFIADYKKDGFKAPPLCGKNKSSADSTDDAKREFALANGLWHYHIGIPEYQTTYGIGNWTSEQVINYVNKNCKASIKLVSLVSHPPFIIPSMVHITGETLK